MLFPFSVNRLRLVCLLGIAAATGCGGGSLHPVEGSVKFTDGTPVVGGNVVFSSVDLQPPVSAKGTIRPDGIFRLGGPGPPATGDDPSSIPRFRYVGPDI